MGTFQWFVVAMGISVVFIGLICIVILCKIMSAICNLGAKGAGKKEKAVKAPAPVVTAAPAEIPNRQEIIAAVTAACAEEMGTDVSALRVVSFKKI